MGGLKLFELDQMLRDAIQAAEERIDTDTGEIPADWAEFLDAVQMERDQKCLAVAAVYREYAAEEAAIKAEAARLLARARVAGNKAESLKQYLGGVVAVGEKLKDACVSIGWRESSSVIIDDEAKLPEACWRVVREPNKTTIKEMLASGTLDGGAHIEKKQNLQVR